MNAYLLKPLYGQSSIGLAIVATVLAAGPAWSQPAGNSATNSIQTYTVKKEVSEFPTDEGLLTPEAAYATWNRTVAADGEAALAKAHASSVISNEGRPFGFQTREGALGILEITDANLSRGVKLRYKLVQVGGEVTENQTAEHAGWERRWVVQGHITDGEGNPTPAVDVTARCGEGTLRKTGTATTDVQGNYTLRFGPGIRGLDEKSGQSVVMLQAATIRPSKPGCFEANLHRQGDLLMADRRPAPGEDVGWKVNTNKLVLPHQPFELNFVMLPAATVEGQLQDENGQPITQQSICLGGDKLPPSSSVLACVETRTNGHFRFENVPTIGRWWFSLSRPNERRQLRSEEFNFVRDFNEPFALRLNPGDNARGISVTGRRQVGADSKAAEK